MANNEARIILPVKMSIVSDVLYKNKISIDKNVAFDALVKYNVPTQYKIEIYCLAVEVYIDDCLYTCRSNTAPTNLIINVPINSTSILKLKITKKGSDVGFYGMFGNKPSSRYDFVDVSTGKFLTKITNTNVNSISPNAETLWNTTTNSSTNNTITVMFRPYLDMPFLKIVPPSSTDVRNMFMSQFITYNVSIVAKTSTSPYKVYINDCYVGDHTKTLSIPYLFDNDVLLIVTDTATKTLPINISTTNNLTFQWVCSLNNSIWYEYKDPLIGLINLNSNSNMFKTRIVGTKQKVKLTMTVDNEFIAYLNGSEITRGRNWQVPNTVNLEMYTNDVIAIDAINYNGSPGALLLEQNDLPCNDGHWKCLPINPANSHILCSNWKSPEFDDSNWLTPQQYGANGQFSSIWNRVNNAGIPTMHPDSQWIWSPVTASNQIPWSSFVYSGDNRVLFRFYPTLPQINSVGLINFLTEKQVTNQKNEEARALFSLTELSDDNVGSVLINPRYIPASQFTAESTCNFDVSRIPNFTPTFINTAKLLIYKTLIGVHDSTNVINEKVVVQDIDNLLTLSSTPIKVDTILFNNNISLPIGSYTEDDLVCIKKYNLVSGLTAFQVPRGFLVTGFTTTNLTGAFKTYTNGTFTGLCIRSLIISSIKMKAYSISNFEGTVSEFNIGVTYNAEQVANIKSFQLNNGLRVRFTLPSKQIIDINSDCYDLAKILVNPVSMVIELVTVNKQEISLFSAINFTTPIGTYGFGKYEISLLPRSIMMSPVYTLTFCKDALCTDVIEVYNNPTSNITKNLLSNGKIYFKVEPRIMSPLINMFEDYLFLGCEKSLPIGNHNLNNLYFSWEKQITNVRLPDKSGFVVEMYDRNNLIDTLVENGSINYSLKNPKKACKLKITKPATSTSSDKALFYDQDWNLIKLDAGEYDLRFISSPKLWRNEISSFYIPYNMQILAYDNVNLLKTHVTDTVFIDWGTDVKTNDKYQRLVVNNIGLENSVYLLTDSNIFRYGVGGFAINDLITKIKVDKGMTCKLYDGMFTGRQITLQEGIYDTSVFEYLNFKSIIVSSSNIIEELSSNSRALLEKYRTLDLSLRTILSLPETISFLLIQIFNSLDNFNKQKLLRYMLLPNINVIDVLCNIMNSKLEIVLFIRDKITFIGNDLKVNIDFFTRDPMLEIVKMKLSSANIPPDFEDYVDYKVSFVLQK